MNQMQIDHDQFVPIAPLIQTTPQPAPGQARPTMDSKPNAENSHGDSYDAKLELHNRIRQRLGLEPVTQLPETSTGRSQRSRGFFGSSQGQRQGGMENEESAEEAEPTAGFSACSSCGKCEEFVAETAEQPSEDRAGEEENGGSEHGSAQSAQAVTNPCASCGCGLIHHLMSEEDDDRDRQVEWSDDSDHLHDNMYDEYGEDDFDEGDDDDQEDDGDYDDPGDDE